MSKNESSKLFSTGYVLCSQLVKVQWKSESREDTELVNLTAIRCRDVTLSSEVAIPKFASASITINSTCLSGSIASCVRDRILGFKVRLHLAKSSRWTRALVEPEHMLDPRNYQRLEKLPPQTAEIFPPPKVLSAAS